MFFFFNLHQLPAAKEDMQKPRIKTNIWLFLFCQSFSIELVDKRVNQKGVDETHQCKLGMYCKKQEYDFFLGKKSICVKCLLLTHLYCKTAKSHPHRTTKGVGEIKPLKARLRSQVHN
jgi:hypothetical protein